jgi:hypothetical protein
MAEDMAGEAWVRAIVASGNLSVYRESVLK